MRTTSLKTMLLVTTACLVLAACGSTRGDRAVSGAGVGAGIGAAAGALTGATVGGAAALGAAAGAATGALTDEDEIDLGKPAWQ